MSQDPPPSYSAQGRPRSGCLSFHNAWGMSWDMSADTKDVSSADATNMLCLLTQQMLRLLTHQVSCLQTHQLPKIPHPGFSRFGTPKTESGNHLDISGDLPGIFVEVVLTRGSGGSHVGSRLWGPRFSCGTKNLVGPFVLLGFWVGGKGVGAAKMKSDWRVVRNGLSHLMWPKWGCRENPLGLYRIGFSL